MPLRRRGRATVRRLASWWVAEMLPTQRNEATIDKAIKYVRMVLDGAENSNQDAEDVIVLMHEAAPMYRRIAILEDLLDRAVEFADGYVDVVDGDYGQPEPNEAMRLVAAIREVMGEE